jgi:hypothetical protein
MKRPNITPGAWRQNKTAVKHDIYDVLDSEGGTIAFVPVADKGSKHAKSNGQAIASVPKLLAALEDIARLVETEPENQHEAQVQRYCQSPAAWARQALIEAGYTFD